MRTTLIGTILLLFLVACGTTDTTTNAPTVPANTTDATFAVAATNTVAPEPPKPSPTIEPAEAASPTAEATATTEAAELPIPPNSLSEATDWLTTALEIGATPDQIREVLVSSGWLEFNDDLRDIHLRGEDEAPLWLVRIVRPASEGEPSNPWGLSGRVYIADPQAREIVYESGGEGADIEVEEAFLPAPTVLTDTDFTGDGISDALFEFTTCGASTCMQEYHVVSYQDSDTPREVLLATGYNSDGEIVDDLPYVLMSYSEAYMGDNQGDSILDLTVIGGTQGSVGAGPQRSRAETYAWDGSHLVLVNTDYEETDMRYFTLLDANNAFDAKEYDTALTLYEAAANDDTLQPTFWHEPPDEEIAAIKRYALFRMVLIGLIQEDYVGAQTEAEQFVADYPDDAVASAAYDMVFRFAQTNSLAEACTQVYLNLADLDPDAVAPLDYMGYSNPELGAATLCPIQE